jgi:hypothetical protein
MAVGLIAQAAQAAEHPTGAAVSDQQEHPTGAPASDRQQHSTGAPGKVCPLPDAGGSKASMARIRKEYVNAVREYVKAKEPFVIHDDKLNKDWDLKLIRVHKDRIVSLGGNKFFACSDFKSVKKGGKDRLDLDFFATKNPDGTWKVEKVLIHKVNGKPRYTWNDKNEMVPAND